MLELKNDHNVYILGAGFSRDRGFPLVADFLNHMRDAHPWLMEKGRQREAEAIERIIEFRLNSASAAYRVKADLENIEELFSLASAKPNSGQLMNQVRLAIAATISYCEEMNASLNINIDAPTGSLKIPSNSEPNSRGQIPNVTSLYRANFYHALIAQLCGRMIKSEPESENTFISFNYDSLVEDAFEQNSIPWTYGFKSRHSIHESLKKTNHYMNESNAIPVYKLHGSVNWAYAKGRGKGFTIFRSYDELLKEGLIPELIPPTWRKVFDSKLSDVWDLAIEKIKTATRIIIIGFSIPETDLHFKHLIAAGLQDNVSLRKVYLISPDENLVSRSERIFRDTVQIEAKKIYTRNILSNSALLSEIGRPCPEKVKFMATYS